MKRFLCWIIPVILAGGAGVMLRADDAAMPTQEIPKNVFGAPEAIWSLEHYTYIVKDTDASGVLAMQQAQEMLKPQGPNAQIEFLNKMLYQTKSRAVEHAIRIQLAQLYRESGQDAKAMDQYQTLMTDNP